MKFTRAALTNECVADHIAKGWDLLSGRFLQQGRTLAACASISVSKANDVLARAHGYASGAQLLQLCAGLADLNAKSHVSAFETGRKRKDCPHQWGARILSRMGKIDVNDVDWPTQTLSLLETNPSRSAGSDAELEGDDALRDIREHMLYQSLVFDDDNLVSTNAWYRIIDLAGALVESDAVAGVSPSSALDIAATTFGLTSANLHSTPDEAYEFAEKERTADWDLFRKPTPWKPRSSDELSTPVPLLSLRDRLCWSDPSILDGAYDAGPALVLALTNGPPDLRAVMVPTPNGDGVAIFFRLFVRHFDDIAAATLTAIATPEFVGVVSREEAERLGSESLSGWYSVEWA